MARPPEVTHINVHHFINFGQSGDSNKSIFQQLQQQGIEPINPVTIWHLRNHDDQDSYRGQLLALQILSKQLLTDETWTTPLMHKLIQGILESGMQLQERTALGFLKSDHFTERIAESQNLDVKWTRGVLRGIRASVTLMASEDQQTTENMFQYINLYVNERMELQNHQPSRIRMPLSKLSGHMSLSDFYLSMYGDDPATMPRRQVGGLTPYEIHGWYEVFKELKNDRPLPLITMILKHYANDPYSNLGIISQEIAQKTNVPVDRTVLAATLSLVALDFPV